MLNHSDRSSSPRRRALGAHHRPIARALGGVALLGVAACSGADDETRVVSAPLSPAPDAPTPDAPTPGAETPTPPAQGGSEPSLSAAGEEPAPAGNGAPEPNSEPSSGTPSRC